jgi:hypothetical protein
MDQHSSHKDEKAPYSNRGFFIIAILFLLLLPSLLVFMLEGLLLFVGYGHPTDLFLPTNDKYLTENPQYSFLFYQGGKDELANEDQILKYQLFRREKPTNTLRGFALGGSSVQGFPYTSAYSFPTMSESLLKAEGHQIEIINLGYSAMSSDYVRYTALKLLDWDPDFLILYTGHNEYFGTSNAFNSGEHWIRDFRLGLKSWRVGQLIFNLIEGANPDADESLMAKQFADKKFLNTDPINDQVSTFYLSNLESVFNEYKERGIPIIIFTPISNEKDMPPFGSEYQSQLEGRVGRVPEGQYSSGSLYFDQDIDWFDPKFQNDANYAYVKALLETDRDEVERLLTGAKDLDYVPFRAKTHLTDSLHTFIDDKDYSNVFLMDSADILENVYGTKFLGNLIFVDHLHLNIEGNWIFARLLADTLSTQFGLDYPPDYFVRDPKFTNLDDFQTTLGIHDYFLLDANIKISQLIQQPPYNQMLIPYLMNNRWRQENLIYNNSTVMEQLTNANESEHLSILYNYYLEQEDHDLVRNFMSSVVKIAKGSRIVHEVYLSMLVELGVEQNLIEDYHAWIKERFE